MVWICVARMFKRSLPSNLLSIYPAVSETLAMGKGQATKTLWEVLSTNRWLTGPPKVVQSQILAWSTVKDRPRGDHANKLQPQAHYNTRVSQRTTQPNRYFYEHVPLGIEWAVYCFLVKPSFRCMSSVGAYRRQGKFMIISQKATIGAESVVVRKVINFSQRELGRCKTRICNYFDKNPECICKHKVEASMNDTIREFASV